MNLNYRNPIFVDDAQEMIDCEIEHPVYGWIPTTLKSSDPENGPLFQAVKASQGVAPKRQPTAEEIAAEQLRADTRDLSPAEFEWLLAYTGLEDVFTGLTASVKASDRTTYAALKADRRRLFYNLDLTLAKVAAFGPQIAAQYPTVDVSETAIRAAWKLATQFE